MPHHQLDPLPRLSMSLAATLPLEVRRLYPFEGRRLELSCGHGMHLLDEGAGSPVLMLHGNPTWSFFYRRLVLGLREEHRCVAPDHIGCGLSDKPADWSYSIADHVENVCEVIRDLDLRNISLVVHDWGGAIGYLAALRMPERFSRFVVFNSAVTFLPLPRWLMVLRIRWLGGLVLQGFNAMVLGNFHLSSRDYPPAVRAGYLAPYDSWDHRIAVRRFVEEIPLESDHPNRGLLRDLEEGLPAVTDRPHLVIWGMEDPVFHRRYLESWKRILPHADFHCLEGAGHWVLEEEHERILPVVGAFLA